MQNRLEREVRILRILTMASILSVLVLAFTAFSANSGKKKFKEIDVQRINVVEQDGKLKMVISNKALQHPGIINGKVIQRDGPRAPGLLFFDQRGDEMGGLIYGDNGGKGHFGSLTFDKVGSDQVVGFRYLESDSGQYSAGLEMWQQPTTPHEELMEKYKALGNIKDKAERDAAIQKLRDNNELTVRRLFVGQGRDDAVTISMHDKKGRERIRMVVPAEGAPKMEFLDAAGKVIYSLPEPQKGS